MKVVLIALAVAAGLLATPVLAQQPTVPAGEHDGHHPDNAQVPAPPSASSRGPGAGMQGGMMPGMGGMMNCAMMGQGGMRQGGMGQMQCPMMQGGMMQGGMMQRGMQGMSGQDGRSSPTGRGAMGQPRGDQSVGSIALGAINQRMHREMDIEYTGNVDADFVRSMIAHHQGAIDMAKIAAAFGKDPRIQSLAQNIIKAQEEEIAMMRLWLAQNVKQ
jgi:uncharacterized protein (DUF305 family)